MADEGDSRVLSKLVLLMQATCDNRFKGGSYCATLAVVLDACYDSARCYIGPTSIGRIAGLNEKTVRECIDALESAGYLRTERRGPRSKWIYPNFEHAERTPRLVSHKDGQQRVHRPVNTKALMRDVAGPQTRNHDSRTGRLAGPQFLNNGSVDPEERVCRPRETVSETVIETVPSSRSLEEHNQQQREALRAEYLDVVCSNEKHARFMEREPSIRKHIADLIQERAA